MKINTNTNARLVRALECVEYWNEKLMDSRSERRELILLGSLLLPDERNHLLGVNSKVTAFIRNKLSEAQFEHADAMEEAADRIADSVPVTFSTEYPVLPANDALFDVYEGQGDVQ